MTYDEFVREYNGKAIDYDGGYGVQCVDLAKLYLDKVFGIKIGAIGNAEAYWRRYDEIPALYQNFIRVQGIPQKGDIVVWGTDLSKNGHIAIATGDGDLQKFITYDQNWGIKNMHLVEHSYFAVSGNLRAKNQDNIVKATITNEDLFDSELYYWMYADLRKNVGESWNNLFAHWISFGIKEGRVASYVFDPLFYYNKYKDLQKAFGKNWKALYDHFVGWGIKEGRQASIVFDLKYYKEQNTDLTFKDNIDYIKHFIQFGIKEFRLTSKDFNVRKYKENYKDLQKAFGNDCKAYYRHYLLYGKNEKRKC